ncbi:hypothetical protein D3C71_1172690 [compost metagenome]
MLHRLVGRAVFAQADRIVRVHVDRVGRDQRAHAHAVAGVIAEHQEGGVERNEAAMQGQAVGDRGHAELAHAVVHVVGVRVVGGDRLAGLPQGQVGVRQIGRTAHQFRQQRRERFDRQLRGLARGDGLAIGLHLGDVGIGLGDEVGRQFAVRATGQLFGLGRELCGVLVELQFPLGLAQGAGTAGTPAGVDLFRNLERAVVPVQRLAGGFQFVLAQRCAVAGFLAGLVRRTKTDRGAAADQGRLAVLRQGRFDTGLDALRIVAIDAAHHVPAIGLETLRGVVGEPAFGVAVDGDVVVIPEADQLVQAPGAGQRGGFVGNAFHQAAVTHEHPGTVVDDFQLRAVEALCQQLLGQGKTDGIGETLAQRTGGGLHARGLMTLRMASGVAAQLAEGLQLLDRQVIAAQVQQRVLQHRAVAVGQHEAVAVEPLGVVGVVTEIVVPEDLGDIGHAHRHAGMPGLGGFDRISGKEADGIGQLAAGRLRHGSVGVGRLPRSCGQPIVPQVIGGVRPETGQALNDDAPHKAGHREPADLRRLSRAGPGRVPGPPQPPPGHRPPRPWPPGWSGPGRR